MWYSVSDHAQWRVYLGVLLLGAGVYAGLTVAAFAQKHCRRAKETGRHEKPSQFLHTVSFAPPDYETRRCIHWFVCLPLRSAQVVVTWLLPQLGLPIVLQALAPFPLMQAYTWFDLALNNKKPVGQFQGPAWWKSQRLLHTVTYASFAIVSVLSPAQAWIALLSDVAWSACAAAYHDVVVQANGRRRVPG